MDITFITMHDLTENAQILYASDSILDVLGYQPREVIGKSTFDYFHPSEAPFAQLQHQKGLEMDRAAKLSYCQLKRQDGQYIRCECVFTVVYSVIVACTSLYQHDEASQARSSARAADAPAISRVFRDARYQMLTHLSPKFTTPEGGHEPRAAIILNRFTRTLSIMYATHTLSDVLGIPAEDATGCSFYECISEECLQDAVDALERAKQNDSIAYLRFRWRDPRNNRARVNSARIDNGGDGNAGAGGRLSGSLEPSDAGSSDDEERSSARGLTPQSSIPGRDEPIEVEAVVSCTSDGLVVILRKVRDTTISEAQDARGVFATPWSQKPLMPVGRSEAANEDLMQSIRQVAVFAWSLRSINKEIMDYVEPGRPKPDSSEKVGNFTTPETTHYKRAREWDDMVEEAIGNKRRATGGN